jgi:hypothetical protein
MLTCNRLLELRGHINTIYNNTFYIFVKLNNKLTRFLDIPQNYKYKITKFVHLHLMFSIMF